MVKQEKEKDVLMKNFNMLEGMIGGMGEYEEDIGVEGLVVDVEIDQGGATMQRCGRWGLMIMAHMLIMEILGEDN